MDLLKAEIAKKRALLQEKSLLGPQKKYFKREELIKKLDEDYWAQNKAKEDQRSSSANEESRMVKVGDDSKMDSGSSKEDRILPRKEVIRRLRERMEPILLFGETENEAFQRLRHLELLEPENNRGLRNDFQEAMEKVDQEFLQELINNGGNRDGESVKQRENDVQIEDMNTSIEEVKQLAANLGKRKEDSSEDCRTVWTFLKFLLEMWGKRLNSRPEHIKMATQGKIASATYTQTVTYLRPLFKQLKSNKVADDILKHLTLIVRFLLERDYVKANDAYLQMAIGNSPWPIGVTMVGIHARTGREKIFSQNIAHVLNDESQRKYIQGLKRLITQCQKIFPTDPSKSVEYNAVNQDIFC